jgi:hypothetical protein
LLDAGIAARLHAGSGVESLIKSISSLGCAGKPPVGQQEPAAPGIALRSQCAHNASRMKPATAEASADYSIFALVRRPSADETLSRIGNRILADTRLRHATDEHIRRQRGRRRPNGRGTDRPVLQREHLR